MVLRGQHDLGGPREARKLDLKEVGGYSGLSCSQVIHHTYNDGRDAMDKRSAVDIGDIALHRVVAVADLDLLTKARSGNVPVLFLPNLWQSHNSLPGTPVSPRLVGQAD